jgi:hypothetical protein
VSQSPRALSGCLPSPGQAIPFLTLQADGYILLVIQHTGDVSTAQLIGVWLDWTREQVILAMDFYVTCGALAGLRRPLAQVR